MKKISSISNAEKVAEAFYKDQELGTAVKHHRIIGFIEGWAAALNEADTIIGSLRKFYNVEYETDLSVQEALNQAQLEIGDLANDKT